MRFNRLYASIRLLRRSPYFGHLRICRMVVKRSRPRRSRWRKRHVGLWDGRKVGNRRYTDVVLRVLLVLALVHRHRGRRNCWGTILEIRGVLWVETTAAAHSIWDGPVRLRGWLLIVLRCETTSPATVLRITTVHAVAHIAVRGLRRFAAQVLSLWKRIGLMGHVERAGLWLC